MLFVRSGRRSKLRELFRIFDKDHDNTISGTELGKMLRCMGMEVTDVEVSNIMKALDRNGWLTVFDSNEDGFIDVNELKMALQNLGEPLSEKELDDLMKDADVTEEGKVNYE
ncbi:unnamed protein product, partial [Candidula unifasciata]